MLHKNVPFVATSPERKIKKETDLTKHVQDGKMTNIKPKVNQNPPNQQMWQEGMFH